MAMDTYFLRDGHLFRGTGEDDRDEGRGWWFEGDAVVQERRLALEEVFPGTIRAYTSCGRCDPVLIRNDTPSVYGDLVSEHQVFVDFELTFRAGEPLRIERTSGDRDALKDEMRRRGMFVLEDGEPLAIAHREIRKARGSSGWSGFGRRRR
jgi:hypothetical protein